MTESNSEGSMGLGPYCILALHPLTFGNLQVSDIRDIRLRGLCGVVPSTSSYTVGSKVAICCCQSVTTYRTKICKKMVKFVLLHMPFSSLELHLPSLYLAGLDFCCRQTSTRFLEQEVEAGNDPAQG